MAERISTISDFIQYIHLKGFGPSDKWNLQLRHDGRFWNYNRTAQTVFQENEGNCGGVANLANYILRGDYSSQGYVQEPGHVYSYFKQDDQFCFIDFVQVMTSKGTYDNDNYKVFVTENPKLHSEDRRHRKIMMGEQFITHFMYKWDGDHIPYTWDSRIQQHFFPHYTKGLIVFLYAPASMPAPKFISVKGVEFTEEAAVEDMKAFEQERESSFSEERKSSFSAEEAKEIMSQMEFGCDAEKTKKGSIKVSTEKVPGIIAKLSVNGKINCTDFRH